MTKLYKGTWADFKTATVVENCAHFFYWHSNGIKASVKAEAVIKGSVFKGSNVFTICFN